MPIDEPCQKLFKESKILALPCLFVYELCKCYVKNKPHFLSIYNAPQTYNTRQNCIHHPIHSNSKFEKSPNYMTRKVLNKLSMLDPDILLSKSFLKKVKFYLVDYAFYSLNELFDSQTKLTT
jgi:hypothetical protein